MEEQFLGKDLLKELCDNKLPAYGQPWPSGPAIIFADKKQFTKKEWIRQVKIFNNRPQPYTADYCSLFHVAYAWAFPDASKYGLCWLKELHKDLDQPDNLPALGSMKKIISQINISIRRHGSNNEKKEFIDEILSMQKTLEKIKESHPIWYLELMTIFTKIQPKTDLI